VVLQAEESVGYAKKGAGYRVGLSWCGARVTLGLPLVSEGQTLYLGPRNPPSSSPTLTLAKPWDSRGSFPHLSHSLLHQC